MFKVRISNSNHYYPQAMDFAIRSSDIVKARKESRHRKPVTDEDYQRNWRRWFASTRDRRVKDWKVSQWIL